MSDTAAPGDREFTRKELLVYLAEVDADFPVPDDGEPVEIAVIGGASTVPAAAERSSLPPRRWWASRSA